MTKEETALYYLFGSLIAHLEALGITSGDAFAESASRANQAIKDPEIRAQVEELLNGLRSRPTPVTGTIDGGGKQAVDEGPEAA